MAQYIDGKVRETRESEVMDIDEDLFRENVVDAKLYGYLKVPNEKRMMQNMKSGHGYSESGSIEQIARCLTDSLQEDTIYIVGGGSTMMKFTQQAGLPGTLLGVDILLGRTMYKADATERDILEALDKVQNAKILVTVIGGQGYVFGRGNQQISANVIKRVGKENIQIAASKDKMYSLFGQTLLHDLGDDDVNEYLRGYYRVLVGYEEYMMFKMED
jgi:predicted polyphosphate/ATP-dependent NAD kinase